MYYFPAFGNYFWGHRMYKINDCPDMNISTQIDSRDKAEMLMIILSGHLACDKFCTDLPGFQLKNCHNHLR